MYRSFVFYVALFSIVAFFLSASLATYRLSFHSTPSAPSKQALAGKTLRVMFIGDSITEGRTASMKFVGHSGGRLPINGSCGFRIRALHRLRQRLAGSLVQAVGPYRGVYGVEGKANVPTHCMATAADVAHAANWGIKLADVNRGFANAFRLRQSASRGSRRDARYAEEHLSETPLHWVNRFLPDVVVVHLGTNDIGAGATPTTVACVEMEALLQLLFGAANVTHTHSGSLRENMEQSEETKYSENMPQSCANGSNDEARELRDEDLQCPFFVFIVALLPREDVHNAAVSAVNGLWLSTRCRQLGREKNPKANLRLLNGSSVSSEARKSSSFDGFETQSASVSPRGSSALFLSSPCVRVVRGLPPGAEVHSLMYDGLHPNDEGEVVIATEVVNALCERLKRCG